MKPAKGQIHHSYYYTDFWYGLSNSTQTTERVCKHSLGIILEKGNQPPILLQIASKPSGAKKSLTCDSGSWGEVSSEGNMLQGGRYCQLLLNAAVSQESWISSWCGGTRQPHNLAMLAAAPGHLGCNQNTIQKQGGWKCGTSAHKLSLFSWVQTLCPGQTFILKKMS